MPTLTQTNTASASSSTGWITPGTFHAGVSAKDGSFCITDTGGMLDHRATLTTFGFSIPGTATITKVEANFYGYRGFGPETNFELWVTKDGSSEAAGSSGVLTLGTTPSYHTIDVSPTALSVAEANATTFGLVIDQVYTSYTSYLDLVSLTITYTDTGGNGTGAIGLLEEAVATDVPPSSSTIRGIAETELDRDWNFQYGTPVSEQDMRNGGKCAWSGFWAPASLLTEVPGYGRVLKQFADRLKPRDERGKF